MDWLKQLRDRFLNLWNGFDTQTKILLGTVFFAIIIGLVFLATWAGKPQYAELYGNLSEADASVIVNWLEESKIPYKLESGGTRIMVPSDQKHKIRLDLAGANVSPTGGTIGFEIFDQNKLGLTEKEQKVRYIRAISGEMSRSIQLLNGVEMAVVQIVIPESSLFIDEEKPTTASVVLKLTPSTKLSQGNVQAITNLLAGGVEGLSPDQVTIIDTAGNSYTDVYNNANDLDHLTSQQQKAKKELENDLQRKLDIALSKMYGPGNAVVTVTAEVDFDQREIFEKNYSPIVGDEGLVRSSQQYSEDYEGNGSQPIGVPGTTTNIPEYQETGGTNSSKYNKEDSTINYELNERQIQQKIADSKTQYLNVSVLINRELNQTQEDQLFNYVATTVGYAPDRGDQLFVLGMPFDNSLEQEVIAALNSRQGLDLRQVILYGVGGLLGISVLWIFFRRPKQKIGENFSRGGRVDTMIGDALGEVAATGISLHQLTPEERARQEMRKEISDLISKKPEDVAQLLKTWLMED